MRLIKDNEIMTLSNEYHIRAFLQSGWKEYKQEEIKKDTTKKRTKKAN